MRRGWLYGLVCAVFVSASIGYGSSVNAVVLDDDCECSSGWQAGPRMVILCPPYLGGCPRKRTVHSIENSSCNMSLLEPAMIVRERIYRDWEYLSDLECNSLGWPADSEVVPIYFPPVGVGPCAFVHRVVKWNMECFALEYFCEDPEKSTARVYKECRPVADMEFGVLPDCECPYDPVVAVPEYGVIITFERVKDIV